MSKSNLVIFAQNEEKLDEYVDKYDENKFYWIDPKPELWTKMNSAEGWPVRQNTYVSKCKYVDTDFDQTWYNRAVRWYELFISKTIQGTEEDEWRMHKDYKNIFDAFHLLRNEKIEKNEFAQYMGESSVFICPYIDETGEWHEVTKDSAKEIIERIRNNPELTIVYAETE